MKIKTGRWEITHSGISTKKENNSFIEFGISDIWNVQKQKNTFIYDLPVHLCSKGWISNFDLLDFNSAFLICQEIFRDSKPINFPNVSWSETLKRQYKRFQKGLDINSYEGRKQYEHRKEYLKKLTFKELEKITRVDLDNNNTNEIEVFGDKNSRKF